MENWSQSIQQMIDIIDRCIRQQEDEALTLRALSAALGYSESYVSRKFRALSGMSLRDYLRFRHLAFALRDVRDTSDSLLEIAVRYGFSSHEAFTRAFRAAYGVTPSAYRLHPTAVVLHTILKPFDCYLLGIGGTGMAASTDHIKTYFITIPAHKFLHIRNYESIGYFDFWQKQSLIPGQDWGDHLRLAGAHPRQPRSFRRQRAQRIRRAADGVHQRADRAHLQLGDSAGGGLRHSSACGLRWGCPRAAPAHGRS